MSLLAQWRSGDREAAGRLLQRHYHETRAILRSRGAHDLDEACERLWDLARAQVAGDDPYRDLDDGEVLRELARRLPLPEVAITVALAERKGDRA